MRCISTLKVLTLILSVVAASSTSQASYIQHDILIPLSQAQITPDHWSAYDVVMPNTAISEGDTIKINLTFSNGKLRWTNNNSWIESAIFYIKDLDGPSGTVSYISDFSFLNPDGELFFNSFSSNTGSGGLGILGTTHNLGKNNLTDSFFEFDGLSFEFAILNADHFPITSNLFDIDLLGGDFSITPVPMPAAVWLFGSGLLVLLGVSRKGQYSAASRQIN